MATFNEVILKALQNGQMKMTSVNEGMIELSKKSAKKAGYIKTIITDELINGLMNKTRVAFILHIDADELNALNINIDANEPSSVVTIQNENERWNALRPEVQWFAEQMELQLKANDHKTGWKDSSDDFLINQVYRNADKIWRTNPNILQRAANVANFAMMIADNSRVQDA